MACAARALFAGRLSRRRPASLPRGWLFAAALLLTSSFALAQTARLQSGDSYVSSVNVYISSVEFTDGVACKKIAWVNNAYSVVDVPSPQFVSGTRADPAVYVRGSTMTLDVGLSTVAEDGPYTNRNIDFTAKYKGSAVTVTPSQYTVSIADGGTIHREVTISGMPECVTLGDFELKIAYYPPSSPQVTRYSTATDKVYLVYDTPVTPMATPWVEVLEDSCTWADGESAAGDVAREITLGEYFAQRFAYPSDTHTEWISPSGAFYLKTYYLTTGWVHGNCEDVSAFLAICLRAQGLAFMLRQYCSDPSVYFPSEVTGGAPVTGFQSVPVCLIGSNPAQQNNATYTVSYWAWHQLAFSPSGTVYDVCAAQLRDLDGYAYRNPPFNWSFGAPGYWQNDPDNWSGLVDTPDPSAPSLIGSAFAPTVTEDDKPQGE